MTPPPDNGCEWMELGADCRPPFGWAIAFHAGGVTLSPMKALFKIVGSVLVACLGVALYVVYINTRADSVAAAITSTVKDQLEAIRSGDYERAYTYAAPGLRRGSDLKRFEAMIRRDYPVVAENKGFVLGDIMHDDDSAAVNVAISNATGRVVLYQYRLGLEKDGWRVQGVAPLRTQSQGRKKLPE